MERLCDEISRHFEYGLYVRRDRLGDLWGSAERDGAERNTNVSESGNGSRSRGEQPAWGVHVDLSDSARTGRWQMQAAGVTRLRSGDLLLNGCTMLTKRSTTMKLFRSSDSGKTWAEQKPIWEKSDGIRLQGSLGALVELQSGRILCPIHGGPDGNAGPFDAWCYYSDDGGKTWAESKQKVKLSKRGAMEPSVAQLRDGTLVMALRTQLGATSICFTSSGKVIIGYCWVKKAWDRRRGSPGGTRVAIVDQDWFFSQLRKASPRRSHDAP